MPQASMISPMVILSRGFWSIRVFSASLMARRVAAEDLYSFPIADLHFDRSISWGGEPVIVQIRTDA